MPPKSGMIYWFCYGFNSMTKLTEQAIAQAIPSHVWGENNSLFMWLYCMADL